MAGGATILVAEDDQLLAGLVRAGLEGAGYQVVVAGDGYQALELARSGSYDLYLLDVMMPGVTGDRVGRQLLRERSDARIVFMTGSYGAELVEDWGPLLRKPFEDWQLLASVEAALAQVPAFDPVA